MGKLRNIVLASSMLLGSAGVITGITIAAPTVASATPTCPSGWAAEYTDVLTANNNITFSDYAHSWQPWQYGSPTDHAYRQWDLCWLTTGQKGNGAYIGTMCIFNEGAAHWLGNNTTEFNENTSTAGGCGPSEEYSFTCQFWLGNDINDGYFYLFNNSTAQGVQLEQSYQGLGNVEVNVDPTDPNNVDSFFNYNGTHFCK